MEIDKLKEVWEDHSNKQYRNDISHIRNTVGRWSNFDLWKRQGETSLKNILEIYKVLNKEAKDLNILEWGPGGGTNILGLSKIVSTYFGVDISETNLNESEKTAIESNVNFKKILLNKDDFEIDFDSIKNIDVFLSTAVFQHFPSKEFAIKVLKIAFNILKNKGIGIIQIRYQNEKYGKVSIKNIDEYKDKHLSSLLFTLEEFWILLKEVGFNPLLIKDIGGNNYATYIFQKDLK